MTYFVSLDRGHERELAVNESFTKLSLFQLRRPSGSMWRKRARDEGGVSRCRLLTPGVVGLTDEHDVPQMWSVFPEANAEGHGRILLTLDS